MKKKKILLNNNNSYKLALIFYINGKEYLIEIKKSNKSFFNLKNFDIGYNIKTQKIETFNSKNKFYLSLSNLNDFEEHYGKGFHYKIVGLLDKYSKTNKNSKKKLEKIAEKWNELKQHEKINQIKHLQK